MTAVNRSSLYQYFQTGDKPTQSQFQNLIDSFVSLVDVTAQSVASNISIGGGLKVNGSVSAASIVLTSATGGNKGSGTINATGIYVNGTLITTTSAGGSGTVTTGGVNQLAYYQTATNTVVGTSALPNGITATAQSAGDTSTKVVPYSAFGQGANGSSLVLIAPVVTASTSPFVSCAIPSGYDNFIAYLTNAVPDTSGVSLQCQLGEGATPIYATSGYAWQELQFSNAGTGVGGSDADSAFGFLTGNISNSSTIGVNGEVLFGGLPTAGVGKTFTSKLYYKNTTPNNITAIAGGVFTADTNAITAIKFFFSSGNILSGRFALYGVRNS